MDTEIKTAYFPLERFWRDVIKAEQGIKHMLTFCALAFAIRIKHGYMVTWL